MKLVLSRNELNAKLSIVSRAVGSRHAVQALSGILLEASAGSVSLRATDQDLSIQATLDGQVEGEGRILLPGKLLADVVRSLGGQTVELEPRSAEKDVELRSGASRFHIRSLQADDFPPPPREAASTVSLPAETVTDTVDTVARAASKDDMRPVLTGVLVTLKDSELTMVATDSYRLSVRTTSVGAGGDAELEANIPARALAELSRVASSENVETIEIGLGESQASFDVGSIRISTVLIDGQFPNYRQLLPETFEYDVRVDRAELLEVTRRVGQLAQRNVPLRLRFSPGELTVSATTPDLGDAEESIPVPFEGDELEIGFNPGFLIDGIEMVKADELLVRLISPLRPGLIEPAEADGFRYLVMPIRLND